MLGTRLRSWMETHIVRSRKKQNRNNKGKSKNSPTASPTIRSNEPIQKTEGCLTRDSSEFSVGPSSMTEDNKEKSKSNLTTNLSSPESAYSTGYSTDGTSPGASIPPEYYINLRTGKHYVQASTGNTGTSEAVLQGTADPSRSTFAGNGCSQRPGGPLTPSSVRKRREEILKRKQQKLTKVFPESSTEEDIADRHSKCNGSQKSATPKEQRKTYHIVNEHCHRRTESYDERARYFEEGQITNSPFPSTASPRQRNRIRTNPWLSVGPNYSSPGETSSTVGSSSTLSSSGARAASQAPPTARVSNYVTSQINPRKPISPVTTCSPQPNRPCHHARPDASSSSSSSAPSSGTDDNHLQGGESSDYSDDDLTLNEMGKYDESYVYEKETDILSDSDPTDCEDRLYLHDNSVINESELQDELDFIDTGSLACSDDYSGKFINRGHCTYGSQSNTPDACKRRKPRSLAGETGSASSRGSSVCGRFVRRGSSRESRGESVVSSSEVTPKRYRKKHQRQASKDRFKSEDTQGVVKGEWRGVEGRQMNLNRVLMERLIGHQRSGTRSADGTPVSLRRNGALEYNGKYLKNPHVSKLINSNNNLTERRGHPPEDRLVYRREGPCPKKRSNSLTVYPPVPIRRTPVQAIKPDEGDVKYRQLIQEAEHILEDFSYKSHRHPHYASPTLSTKSAVLPSTEPPVFTRPFPNECDIRSQINLIEETINNNPVPKIGNDEGILKTISKTLEKIMIRNPNVKRIEKSETTGKSQVSNKEYNERCYMTVASPEHDYVNSLPFQTTPCTDRNDNFFRGTLTTFAPRKIRDPNIRTNNHDRDASTPTVNPRSRLTLWSNDSDIVRRTPCDRIPEDKTPTPKTPLIPFKSFDLGNQVAATSKHCPQSEPVKRKVYACSSTFGKLQKSLMRTSPEPDYDEIVNMPTEELKDENLTLKEKVAQLRRERLQVEARVRETQQQIDRLRLAESSSHC